TVPRSLPTASIALFGRCVFLRFRYFESEARGAALTERLLEFWKDDLQLVCQRPWWIHDQKPGGNQRAACFLRRHAEFQAQTLAGRLAERDCACDLAG